MREKAEHERKEAEEREKEAARLRREKREKLEKEGQQYIEDLFQSSFMVDFELTDDENDDEQTDPKSNGKPAKDDEDAEDKNGVPDKTEGSENGNVVIEPTDEDDTDLDEIKKPLGAQASDANSSVSSYSTPSRTPRTSQHLIYKSGTKNPRPMSANTVQILSNPNLIVAFGTVSREKKRTG